ncbi:MAG: hypothetical protein LBT44_07620, partial [Clostridiales bacterium]|nr:hypothetical protein [Clostridiales bacterium]
MAEENELNEIAASVILMRKNGETGFLEEEIASYPVKHEAHLERFYAEGEPLLVHMRVRVDPARELTDEAFEAVYDYYETDRLL